MASWLFLEYLTADATRRDEPLLPAVIELDGASPGMGILHMLDEVEPGDIEIGMKVEAVWKPEAERQGAITDILYFRPLASAAGATDDATSTDQAVADGDSEGGDE